MRRNLGASTGVIALLALAAHTLSQSGGDVRSTTLSTSQDSGSKADKNKEEANTPPEGPWLATRAFFGTKPKLTDKGEEVPLKTPTEALLDSTKDQDQLKTLLGFDAATCVPENSYAVVATVADPAHTRLALFFDGQVDSIERGAEEAEWVFARQWLPWSDPFDGTEHDISERRKQRELEAEQEAFPGILIFRKDDNPRSQSCLFVLLSPETPTAGVSSQSLTSALNIANVLSPTNKIGLLAPSFSGSFASLEQVVSKWAPKNPPRLFPSVYGGSVSSQKNAEAFLASRDVRKGGIEHFFSGVLQSDESLYAFGELCDKYGIDRASIAYLTEEESGYGTALARSFHEPHHQQGQYYEFPRDISHLRNAYQQASANLTAHPQSPIPSIELSLNDPNRGEDSIPIYSETDTPVVQSAGLSAVAEDMKRRAIRMVYIAATNSLDELFLAQFLHQECPNIRIVIGGDTDMLFLPAAAQRSLAGTLFLSTYPMFFEGDNALTSHWNFGRYSLGSQSLQGLFNVTQLLLWHLQGLRDLNPPAGLRGYASLSADGKAATYPGEWLLDLTRFGFTPIDWLPSTKAEGWMEPSPEPAVKEEVRFHEPLASTGWYIAARLTAIAILAACLFFCFLSRSNRISWPVWSGCGDTAAVRFPFFVGACLFLSALPWIFGVPAAYDWSEAPSGQKFTVWLLAAAFLAPLVLVTCVRVKRVCPKEAGFFGFCTDPMLVFSRYLYLLIMITWWVSCNGHDAGHAMFRWRALHFFFGSSPALPLWLVCNAAVIVLMAEFYRRADTGLSSPHLALSGNKGIEAFSACYREVNQLIAGTFKWPRIATCVMVTGVSIVLLWRDLAAFENPAYSVLVETLVFSLIWALASLAYDATAVWFNLSKLLKMIESIPLRGVMEHAARALPRRQVWAFWKSAPQQAIGVRMCEALHNRKLADEKAAVRSLAAVAGGAFHDGGRRANAQPAEAGILGDDFLFLRLFRSRFAGNPDMSASEVYDARVAYEVLAATTAQDLYSNALWPRWLGSEISEVTGTAPDDELPKDAQHFACDFVALQCCNYLTHVVRRTQQMVWNISFLLVLLIVVLNSYSVQGPVSIGRFIAVLFVATGCVVVYVFAGMERNWVLSKISQSTPGELNMEFWLHLAALGILPLLAVIVHLFPEVANFVYSWVAPGAQSAK